MSDYQESKPTTRFELALEELIARFLGEGTPREEIAGALEEAALRAGDEELGDDDEWREKRPA